MPLQVSTRCRYGLRLMVSLAMNYGRGITLMKDVSRAEGISEKYLGQIIIPLKSAGLVDSRRGSHGGYALSRPPQRITARDVVEAFEGRITAAPRAQADRRPRPRSVSRVTAGVWEKLSRDMEDSLASFTLSRLAREARETGESAADYVI
jgi:Rrf2 family protein